ncbi:AAA family ATPase [Paenibacillus qinlingensis]|uniref:ABC-type cobalamin/Fe3+-siderophores transport system ATPase subunit n=1 Tax=Paenibacillus qinlingensis TaxID=1837343 RepID=A0ABU1P2K8_9BACL|nr:AAA family ATPase [Paenibacillus qinlingensis]MDR6553966.1 ABC-type cobalamin/Fe3+-siderophores transport system ATPase subunit [Paenibacillus qinlingensis]
MKIKSIQIENNKILGTIFLNFCHENGKVADTVIIAGENGCGKSTLLNILFDFTINQGINPVSRSEKRVITIELNESEQSIIKSISHIANYCPIHKKITEMVLSFDFSIINEWEYLQLHLNFEDQIEKIPSHVVFNDMQAKTIFKSIFSDVDINYNPGNISYVTSKNIDEMVNSSFRSNNNLANDIKQLLIDVQALDDADHGNWYRENIGNTVTIEKSTLRMQRFEEAFHSMFKNKKYKCIRNVDGVKKVLFEENGNEIAIEDLSSGEKQIVFRGSFLLKDKKSTDGALILIDEPEISLHPSWQKRIMEFYRNLFINEIGEQTSQIFITTHSPFIIHNKNRLNDKVIVLQRNQDDVLLIPDTPTFIGWSSEEEIQQAFKLDISFERTKPLIITEGKTDWKHLSKAFSKLVESNHLEELNINFLEYGDEIKMGSDELKKMCIQYSKVPQNNKIIFIFDRDEDQIIRDMCNIGKSYKNWGNNVYSLVIPVPAHRTDTPQVCIELYYHNYDLYKVDKNDRRLFLSNEFNPLSSRHNELDLNCTDSKIRGTKISIIDDKVFDNKHSNVALTKSDFSDCIYNDDTYFSEIDFEPFLEIYSLVKEIIQDK